MKNGPLFCYSYHEKRSTFLKHRRGYYHTYLLIVKCSLFRELLAMLMVVFQSVNLSSCDITRSLSHCFCWLCFLSLGVSSVTGQLSEGSFVRNGVVRIPKFDAKPNPNSNPNPSPNPNPNPVPIHFGQMTLRTSELSPSVPALPFSRFQRSMYFWRCPVALCLAWPNRDHLLIIYCLVYIYKIFTDLLFHCNWCFCIAPYSASIPQSCMSLCDVEECCFTQGPSSPKMTYTVSSGTLNSTIPYHTILF